MYPNLDPIYSLIRTATVISSHVLSNLVFFCIVDSAIPREPGPGGSEPGAGASSGSIKPQLAGQQRAVPVHASDTHHQIFHFAGQSQAPPHVFIDYLTYLC